MYHQSQEKAEHPPWSTAPPRCSSNPTCPPSASEQISEYKHYAGRDMCTRERYLKLMFDRFIFRYDKQQPGTVVAIAKTSRMRRDLDDVAFLHPGPVRVINNNALGVFGIVHPGRQDPRVAMFQRRGNWRHRDILEARLDGIGAFSTILRRGL